MRTALVGALAFVSFVGCAVPPDGGFAQNPDCVDGKCDSPFAGGIIPGVAALRIFSGVKLNIPVQMLQAPGDASRWFVLEHAGAIKIIPNDPNARTFTTFIDLTGPTNLIYESGLNAMAFDAGFAQNGRVYITYDAKVPPPANAAPGSINEEWRLSRFESKDGGQTLDPGSELILLSFPKFADEHNAGMVDFGKDGFLYVSIGDGGPSFDPHQQGQNLNVPRGKMLRLDVSKDPNDPTNPPDPEHPGQRMKYGVPADNPFAQGGGRPDIYAWGIRNLWRWSFDRATGDLFGGEVGQDAFDGILQVTRGANFGWSVLESNHCAPMHPNCNPNDLKQFAGNVLTKPFLELPHANNMHAAIGGYVYRGNKIPALKNRYFFADYQSGSLFAVFTGTKGEPVPLIVNAGVGDRINSFAQDADGEIYIMTHETGGIYRLVPGPSVVQPGTGPAPYKFLAREGIGTLASATDYYTSIGAPAGLTLDTWIAENLAGERVSSYYRNAMDLGFWREMSCTKTIGRGVGGCMVRNWTNERDRTAGDPKHQNLGTVTMNVSPEGFTRFYVFGTTGVLQPFAVLDSEGKKFVPELCTTCHSGHYSGGANPGAGASSDLGSIFREFEPGLFQIRHVDPNAQPDNSPNGVLDAHSADLEFSALNDAVLQANQAIRTEAQGSPPGTDHAREAISSYLGTIYDKTDPANPVRLDVSDPKHLPPSWNPLPGESATLALAKQAIYTKTVSRYCMGCHRINPVDFSQYANFLPLTAQVGGLTVLEHYILDSTTANGRQNPRNALNILNAGRETTLYMPQAKLTFDNINQDLFALNALQDWLIEAFDPSRPQTEVTFEIDGVGFTNVGDDVWVVGDTAPLSWTPTSGIKLDGSRWPNWFGSVTLPQNTNVQWKALVLFANGQVAWELGANQVVQVGNATRQTVVHTPQF